MQKKIDKFTIEEINSLIKESKSFRQLMIKLGFSTNGGGDYVYVKQQLDLKGIDYSCLFFLKKSNGVVHTLDEFGKLKRIHTDEDLFIVDCKVDRKTVKHRVIKNNLIPYKCKECGNIGEWNGKKLVLQLEHINGINNDNRLNNLCFLCPNCHTQTDTFTSKKIKKNNYCECGKIIGRKSKYCCLCAGKHTLIKNQYNDDFDFEVIKNELEIYTKKQISKKYNIVENTVRRWEKKCKIRPTKETLIQEIQNLGYVQVGRKYGVSDNAVRKWIKSYGLDPKTIKIAP